MAKEHRIPLVRIRCMTVRRYKELKKLWGGQGLTPAGESPITGLSFPAGNAVETG